MGQHYVEVEARVVCTRQEAEALMGHVEHVDFQPGELAVDYYTAPAPPEFDTPPPGIARIHASMLREGPHPPLLRARRSTALMRRRKPPGSTSPSASSSASAPRLSWSSMASGDAAAR